MNSFMTNFVQPLIICQQWVARAQGTGGGLQKRNGDALMRITGFCPQLKLLDQNKNVLASVKRS